MADQIKLTPVVLAKAVRENLNANGTMKAQFRTNFLAKFSDEELEGLKIGVESEIEKRKMAVVNEKIKFLEEMGYSVSK